MNLKLFVTGTATDIGKTYVTKHLFHFLQQQGWRTTIFKPFQTEVLADGTYPDLESYKRECGLSYERTSFYTFKDPVSPHLAFKREPQQHFDLQAVIDRIQTLDAQFDIVIIEGAGGIAVPIYEGETEFYMTTDLIRETADFVLTILPAQLGAISDAVVHHYFIQSMALPPTLFMLNRYQHRPLEQDNFETIEKLTGQSLEVFPENGTALDFSESFLSKIKGAINDET